MIGKPRILVFFFVFFTSKDASKGGGMRCGIAVLFVGGGDEASEDVLSPWAEGNLSPHGDDENSPHTAKNEVERAGGWGGGGLLTQGQ